MSSQNISSLGNCIAYVALTQISTTTILDWVYTIVFCISIIFSIVMSIITATKDRKITKEEAENIKKTVDDSIDKIKEFRDEKKEGK